MKLKKRIELSNEFRKNHKGFILFCDILVFMVIISNFGALMLTNILVVKENPGIEETFQEMNPLMKEVHDFEGLDYKDQEDRLRFVDLFSGIFIQCLFWAAIIMCYVFMRNTTRSYSELFLMVFCCSYLFYLSGYDFFNDLGYWIGTKVS